MTSCDELSQVGSNNNNSNNNSNNKEENNIKEEPPKRGKKKDGLSSSTHTPLEKRKEKFYESLLQYVSKYGKDMVRAFFDHWTETNKNQSKMRFEDEKFFDISKRLATWDARDRFNTNKGKQDNSRADAIKQQQREDEAAERNRRYEEMRRNAVSYADAKQSDEYQRALREN